jgi:hypothetical protein
VRYDEKEKETSTQKTCSTQKEVKSKKVVDVGISIRARFCITN